MKNILRKILRPRGKLSFLSSLKEEVKILDVGCGNNSPYLVKSVLPCSNYVGLDIGDYNQSKPNLADRYILSSPSDFANQISKFNAEFDAVLSSHNIEHCNERLEVFINMLKALKTGGKIYLSFPSEESVNFPARDGTLNYYDDCTHTASPPNFAEFISILKENNFTILYSSRAYKPSIMWFIGLIAEPYSRYVNKTFSCTWAYYGFESIIWAEKKKINSTIFKASII